MGRAGRPERAARIFGAADALREKTGATMYGGQRAVYETNLQRARPKPTRETWKEPGPRDEPCPWKTLAAWRSGPSYQYARPRPPLDAKEYDLSEREIEVLSLLAAGLTYAEIAERLTVSFHTVHAHLRSIYHKLDVTSRSQAARFATEHKLSLRDPTAPVTGHCRRGG